MSTSQNFPTITPSLSLDFANVQALDPRITYTRASTATYYGTETAKAEQNLLLQSQFAVLPDYWNNDRSVITQNAIAAPDGTTTALSIIQASGQTTSGAINTTPSNRPTLNAGDTCISVFAKPNGKNRIIIREGYLDGTFNDTWFDVQNGTIGTTDAGHTATISASADGYYRCAIKFTMNASRTASILFYIADTDGSFTVADDGNGVYLWGAQLEQRSTVTAYTPTTTQPITNYIPVLESAASGVARFDHNPTTFESLGFLVEEQRTNLLLRSEEFNNASWNKTTNPVTATANQLVAPDGTISADLLSNATNNTRHYTFQTFGSGVASTAYAVSIYVKKGTQRYIVFGDAGDAVWRFLIFDFDTATITSQNNVTGTVTSVGNGWYRVSATFTRTNAGNVSILVGFSNVSSTDIPPTYVGATTDNFYVWGAQLEAGAFATSYIPTVASQVTRAADAASMTGTNFSSFYNQAEGTVYVEATAPEVTSNARGIYAISDGTTSNRIQSIFANELHLVVSANGTIQAAIDAGSLTANQSSKLAATVKRDDMAAVLNGGSVATDSSALMPVVDRLFFGSGSTGTPSLCGTIRKISYYPIRLTNAQLQALTS